MSADSARILVVDDEAVLRTVLSDVLVAECDRLMTAVDGPSGLERALTEQPDLLLLDVMMPGLDGREVVAELRRLGRNLPVLLLTAKGQVDDRVLGLDAGADDYLVKPFSTGELLARVRALLRRVPRGGGQLETRLQWGEVTIDFARMEVRRGGVLVHLTAKEFALLRLLAETPGEPVTRERCLDRVWGVTAFPTTRTVDTHMAALRAKLEAEPDTPRYLKTVHGVGYKLVPNPE
jgi:DNA-binding response OmpR family regulator